MLALKTFRLVSKGKDRIDKDRKCNHVLFFISKMEANVGSRAFIAAAN